MMGIFHRTDAKQREGIIFLLLRVIHIKIIKNKRSHNRDKSIRTALACVVVAHGIAVDVEHAVGQMVREIGQMDVAHSHFSAARSVKEGTS